MSQQFIGGTLDHRRKFFAARVRAVNAMPYFSHALFGLRFVETPGIGTISTDEGMRTYYDPEYVEHACTVETLATTLLHECQHVLRDHSGRVGDRDRDMYNIAGDCEINDDLVEMGMEFPKPVAKIGGQDVIGLVLQPKMIGAPDGKTAEFYYDHMLDQQDKQQKKGGKGDPQGGPGGRSSQGGSSAGDDSRDDGSAGGGGSGDRNQRQDQSGRGHDEGAGDSPSGSAGESGAGSGQANGGGSGGSNNGSHAPRERHGGPTSGQCGGCAGNPKPWEGKGTDGDGADLPPPVDRGEREVVRRATAVAIQEHVKGRGTVPGNLKLWADSIFTPPRVPWERILAALVRQAVAVAAGATDFSYGRLSRRTSGMIRQFGIKRAPILPSMVRPVPKVGVIVDTSGSMSGSPVENAMAQALEVVKALGVPVDVWSVDAAVQATKRVMRKLDTKDLFVGFGGTDMRVGIAAAAKVIGGDAVIVVLTDGYTPWPDPAHMPKAPVVAAIIGDPEIPVPTHIKRVVRIPLADVDD